MRLFLVILLCLGLATCASHVPQARILSPADASLAGRHSFELIDPQASLEGEAPFPERYRQLPQLLRHGLSNRGYHESQQPQLRVYYWLAVQDGPLLFKVDTPPPDPLGPYQAIHRLRDETGTLRLRLTDLDQRILWEGVISTGLSPARDSAELLERAVRVLTEQIPQATP
ncbi:DUF4136 domain-containing protein [Pseudomonas sp. KB-10]|uniref:DUF4136 domain-containing protein n=1 Tax=Pseudomonas sp. KB-10 TaxID=2292264 RepID=UPI001BAF8673|nr:DUF4136 domain-containing protein [Pseudomonas sp. KB-10]